MITIALKFRGKFNDHRQELSGVLPVMLITLLIAQLCPVFRYKEWTTFRPLWLYGFSQLVISPVFARLIYFLFFVNLLIVLLTLRMRQLRIKHYHVSNYVKKQLRRLSET